MTNRLNHRVSLLQSGDHPPDALLEPNLAGPGEVRERISHEKPEEPAISDEESQALRQEKLEAIKAAVARGDYDSDDLLEKAMDRMLDRLGLDEIG
ncbi:MAG: hypothetical protein ACK58L_11265 [Planctomycetota bacterium]